jgi:acyl-coenzyme A synthetase/AMP-(fatty) acid ligase
MSETGWGTQTPLSLSKDLKNCQTIGKVVPNTEIKIIDSNGRSLPANEQGELCARSEQVRLIHVYMSNTVTTKIKLNFCDSV